MKLGLNGMGRIGKLSLWHHVARQSFKDGIVVNLGRPVGRSLEDIAQTVEKDSTYGRLANFLHGYQGERVIEELDEATGFMRINGIPVHFLRTHRNPKDINWRNHEVRLVVDCTGIFLDPTLSADAATGSLRGHMAAGAEKVLLSAPFKIKDPAIRMPEDAATTIMGINESDFIPGHHHILSTASCTTTCLAFMIKPLLDHFGPDKILSASMVTIHAATSSQVVLDSVPGANTKDLRKTRSILNNIILTTTGAASALRRVIPEMAEIGFMAESVRIPTATGSLIILTLNLQSDDPQTPINRTDINRIFQNAAQGAYQDYLRYTEEQNVSSDIIGFPKAAVLIEAQETHTRTAFTRIHLDHIPGIPQELLDRLDSPTLKVPVTQATLYGWYDNELGSYANMLGDMTRYVADKMF